jgi:hypothetical protein
MAVASLHKSTPEALEPFHHPHRYSVETHGPHQAKEEKGEGRREEKEGEEAPSPSERRWSCQRRRPDRLHW